MKEKTFTTPLGTIHYWTSDIVPDCHTLVFLPGLTADHRLFGRQVEGFKEVLNLLVWDAPGHAASRPFELTFSLADKARWLHEILAREGIQHPVLVGQSMGGYVLQAFIHYFPGEAAGCVCIDSAPLQRKYYPKWELSLLRHVEPLYRMFPWKMLVRLGSRGCAVTPYSRQLMVQMMSEYEENPRYYSRLVGHGYRMLADAIEADLPYTIDCPCLILCGEMDKAGDTRIFNRRWEKGTGLPIRWIPDAGHNSNTDQPDLVNALIREWMDALPPIRS